MKKIAAIYRKIRTHLRFKKKQKTPFVRDPFRSWEIIVVSSAIVCVVVFALSSLFFYKIYTGNIFLGGEDSSSVKPKTIDKDALQKTADFYNAREQKVSDLQKATIDVIDPSTSY